jgi:hydrogenase maturation factor HypF (carbamoyltransferase family)
METNSGMSGTLEKANQILATGSFGRLVNRLNNLDSIKLINVEDYEVFRQMEFDETISQTYKDKQYLKYAIRKTEERLISYKKMLEDAFKNKIDSEWYKEHLREMKNHQEHTLKILNSEMTLSNFGANPPFFYN